MSASASSASSPASLSGPPPVAGSDDAALSSASGEASEGVVTSAASPEVPGSLVPAVAGRGVLPPVMRVPRSSDGSTALVVRCGYGRPTPMWNSSSSDSRDDAAADPVRRPLVAWGAGSSLV